MKKKLVSALLCAAMVSSLLAGCGGSDAPAADSGSDEGPETPAADAAGDSAAASSD